MFTVSDALRFGWTRFRVFGGPLLMLGSAAVMLTLISQGLLRHGDAPGAVMAAVSLGAEALVGLVLARAALRHFDGREVSLFEPAPLARGFGWWLASGVVVALLTLGGLVLAIVPGVLVMVTFGFAPMLATEGAIGPVRALRASWNLTAGARGRLLGLGAALTALNSLGLLALGIGLAVTVPVSALAVAFAYRRLQGRAEVTLQTAAPVGSWAPRA